jgi:hypothetical protein
MHTFIAPFFLNKPLVTVKRWKYNTPRILIIFMNENIFKFNQKTLNGPVLPFQVL